MATPSTECYCGMSQLDILKLILESDTAIFDRLSQVITAASSSTSCCTEAGINNIANGSDTVSVVFPVPFATVPTIQVSIARPVASPLIDVNIDRDSVTVNGFTASLGGSPASGDYRLHWMAQTVTP